jgi:hypothetical protein
MGRMTSCMDVRSNNREVHKERSGGSHSRRSGFSEISGWVIRVLYNLGFENRYPKMYNKFLLPNISDTRYFGFGFWVTQNYTSSTSVQFKL